MHNMYYMKIYEWKHMHKTCAIGSICAHIYYLKTQCVFEITQTLCTPPTLLPWRGVFVYFNPKMDNPKMEEEGYCTVSGYSLLEDLTAPCGHGGVIWLRPMHHPNKGMPMWCNFCITIGWYSISTDPWWILFLHLEKGCVSYALVFHLSIEVYQCCDTPFWQKSARFKHRLAKCVEKVIYR